MIEVYRDKGLKDKVGEFREVVDAGVDKKLTLFLFNASPHDLSDLGVESSCKDIVVVSAPVSLRSRTAKSLRLLVKSKVEMVRAVEGDLVFTASYIV